MQRTQPGPPNVFLPITRRFQNKRIGIRSFRDNNGVTGLHNSYPRVIAALRVLLELVYL